jgi:predicted ester cyclase
MVIACAPTDRDHGPRVQEANEILLNQGQTDRLMDFFLPDYVGHGIDGDATNPNHLVGFVNGLREAFPDIAVETEPIFQSGDWVVWLRDHRGTHLGDFMGMPASEREVTWRDIVVTRYEGDMIAEEWGAGNLAERIRMQPGCPVQGVWQLESATADGEAVEVGAWRQMKMITGSNFTWVGQEPGPEAFLTRADSLAALRATAFGGGRYEVTEDTYTEHLDYFYNPEYVGRSVTFSCRVEGDTWYQEGEYPVIEGGQETRSVQLAEVWRRIG